MSAIVLDANSIIVGMLIAGALWLARDWYLNKAKMKELENYIKNLDKQKITKQVDK